jgi:hypothetical protein
MKGSPIRSSMFYVSVGRTKRRLAAGRAEIVSGPNSRRIERPSNPSQLEIPAPSRQFRAGSRSEAGVSTVPSALEGTQDCWRKEGVDVLVGSRGGASLKAMGRGGTRCNKMCWHRFSFLVARNRAGHQAQKLAHEGAEVARPCWRRAMTRRTPKRAERKKK